MVYEKGQGGRPKGSLGALNKLRDELLDTFNAVGGKNRLIRELKDNPEAYMDFLKLIVKLIPKEHNVNIDTVVNYLTHTPRPILEDTTKGKVIEIEGDSIDATTT